MSSPAAGTSSQFPAPQTPVAPGSAAAPPPQPSSSKRDKPSYNPFSACFGPGRSEPSSPPQRSSTSAAPGSSSAAPTPVANAQAQRVSDSKRSAAKATVHVSPGGQRGLRLRPPAQDTSKSLDSVRSASEPAQGPRSKPSAAAARAHGPSRPQTTCESMVAPASALGASTLDPPSMFASTGRLQATLPGTLTGPDIKPADATASASARSPTSASLPKTAPRDALGRSYSTLSAAHKQDFHTRELTLKLNNEVRLRQQYQAATEKLTIRCQELQSRLSSHPDNMARRLLRSIGASSGALDSLPDLTSTWIIPWKELEFGPAVTRELGEETRTARYLGMTVTVKEVTTSGGSSLGASHAEERFFREVNALAAVRHPNCALFMGCCLLPEKGRYYIVTEYLGNGSVFDRIHGVDSRLHLMNPQWLHRVALSVCQTMVYLHSRSPVIVHRNLTTRSLLCDDNLSVKIAEFGLSLMYRKSEGSGREMQQGGDEDQEKPIDVYCYGMLLWELVTGCAPFDSSRLSPDDAITLIKSFAKQSMRPPIPDSTNPSLRALISACWAQQPALRPSFVEVLPVLEAPHAAEWLFAKGDVRFAGDPGSQSRLPPLTARSIQAPGLYPLRLPNFAAAADVSTMRAQLRPTHVPGPSRFPAAVFPPESFRKPLPSHADPPHGFALQPTLSAPSATPWAAPDELGPLQSGGERERHVSSSEAAPTLFRRSSTARTPAEQLVVTQSATASKRKDVASATPGVAAPRAFPFATSLPFDLGGIAQGDAKDQIDALFSIEADSSGGHSRAHRSQGMTAAAESLQADAAPRAPASARRFADVTQELVSPGWASAGNLSAQQNRAPRDAGPAAAAVPQSATNPTRDPSRNTVDALWSREDRDGSSASASAGNQQFLLQQLDSSSPEDSEENVQGASSLLELLKPSELAPDDLHRLLQAAPFAVAAARRRRGAFANETPPPEHAPAAAASETRSVALQSAAGAPLTVDAAPKTARRSFAYSYAADVPIGESRCIAKRLHKASAGAPQPSSPDSSPTLKRRRAPSPFRLWWPLSRHARPEEQDGLSGDWGGPPKENVHFPASCDAPPDPDGSIRSTGSTFYNLQSVSVLNKTRETCGDDDTQHMTSSTPSSASQSTRLLCAASDGLLALASSTLEHLHTCCAEPALARGDNGKAGAPPPPGRDIAAAASATPPCSRTCPRCSRAAGLPPPLSHDMPEAELGGGASAFDDLRIGGGDASGCRCGAVDGLARGLVGGGDAERASMSTHSLLANSGLEWVYTEQESATPGGPPDGASRQDAVCLGDDTLGASPPNLAFETPASWRANGVYCPDDTECGAAQLLRLCKAYAPAPSDATMLDCPLFVPRRGEPEAAVACGTRARLWGCRRSASAPDVTAPRAPAGAKPFDAPAMQRALSAPHSCNSPLHACGEQRGASLEHRDVSAAREAPDAQEGGLAPPLPRASSLTIAPGCGVDALGMTLLGGSSFNVPGALLHPSCLHWSLDDGAQPLCLAPLEVKAMPSGAAEARAALAPDKADRAHASAQSNTAQLRAISEEDVNTMSLSPQAMRSLFGPPAVSQMSNVALSSFVGAPAPPVAPPQPRTVTAALSAAATAACHSAPRRRRSASM